MILRAFARRPGAAIPSLPRTLCRAPCARRLHQVPSLLNHSELERRGVPGLFSKEQFDIAYTQYQGHLMSQLNEATSGKLLHRSRR